RPGRAHVGRRRRPQRRVARPARGAGPRGGAGREPGRPGANVAILPKRCSGCGAGEGPRVRDGETGCVGRARRRILVVLLAALALLPAGAEALYAPQSGVVSANPADTTPNVLDGMVTAIVPLGNRI